jgi:DNA-binding LacI/PurR family transcriptional regulator
MVSVLDVARHAGVSAATVSRVIGGHVRVASETKARVLDAVQLLGYRPNIVARSLRSGRGRAVALVTGDIEQGIYARLAKRLQSELEAIGLDLLLFNLGHREDRLHHLLAEATLLGLRGILLALPHVMDMRELKPLIQTASDNGVDVLSLSQDLTDFGVRSIVHDDAGGAAAAAEHLIRRGRGPIAFVGRIETSAVGRARYDGYRDALRAHGLDPEPALVWNISEGYRADAGYLAVAQALAEGSRFGAVLAASDELALGGMAAAADRGLRVPEDIAFVGFGGLAWGVFSRPSMTTVSLDVEAVARAVGSFFEFDEQAIVERQTIPTKLIIRQSA